MVDYHTKGEAMNINETYTLTVLFEGVERKDISERLCSATLADTVAFANAFYEGDGIAVFRMYVDTKTKHVVMSIGSIERNAVLYEADTAITN